MDDEVTVFLRGVPLFSGLDPAELGHLATLLRRRQVPAGALVWVEGEAGDVFDVIFDGQAAILKSLGTPDERLLRVCGPGEFFGEMTLIDPARTRSASVRAESDLCLLEMRRPDFEALLQRQPLLSHDLVRTVSLYLRAADDATIADLRAKNAELQRAYADLQAAQAQMIEKERLEKELQTARWIQQSILPHELPRLDGYDFAARMHPARAVGGDLYDLMPLGRDAVGVVIGDVSDKGVPAAIFMALTRSLLRAEATRSTPPGRVLERANHLLLDMNDAGMFVTVIYGILDRRSATFAYARAGHELPLLLGPGDEVMLAPQGVGQPLALFDSPLLDVQSLPLPPGCVLLLYTDGATDMQDAEGAAFGQERLLPAAAAARRAGGNAQQICDSVWEALERWRGPAVQADDVALVVIAADGGQYMSQSGR